MGMGMGRIAGWTVGGGFDRQTCGTRAKGATRPGRDPRDIYVSTFSRKLDDLRFLREKRVFSQLSFFVSFFIHSVPRSGTARIIAIIAPREKLN